VVPGFETVAQVIRIYGLFVPVRRQVDEGLLDPIGARDLLGEPELFGGACIGIGGEGMDSGTVLDQAGQNHAAIHTSAQCQG